MVEIETIYEGHLRCRAKHLPSGTEIITDAPLDNHGKGESFSPTDLIATALATCMSTIMGIQAEKHQLNLDGLRIKIGKQMSTTPPRRISKLIVDLWFPKALDEKQIKMLEQAAKQCPVYHSLHPDIEKQFIIHS